MHIRFMLRIFALVIILIAILDQCEAEMKRKDFKHNEQQFLEDRPTQTTFQESGLDEEQKIARRLIMKLQELIDSGEEQRVQSILKSYIDFLFPEDSKLRCDPQRVSLALTALTLESKSANDGNKPQSKAFVYLKDNLINLFSHCKEEWDREFVRLIRENVQEPLKRFKNLLLNALISTSSAKKDAKTTSNRQLQLKQITQNGFPYGDEKFMPPVAGIILYLSYFESFLNLDENMKNEHLHRSSFDLIIRKLIRPYCVSVQRTFSRYIEEHYAPLGQESIKLLDSQKSHDTWKSQQNDEIQEWLVINRVCAKLMQEIYQDDKFLANKLSHSLRSKYLDRVFKEISDQGELIEIDAEKDKVSSEVVDHISRVDQVWSENRRKQMVKDNAEPVW